MIFGGARNREGGRGEPRKGAEVGDEEKGKRHTFGGDPYLRTALGERGMKREGGP